MQDEDLVLALVAAAALEVVGQALGRQDELPEVDRPRREARGTALQVVLPHAPEALVVFFGRQLTARRDRVVPPGLARPFVVDPEVVPVLELPAVADAARLEEGLGPRDAGAREDVLLEPGVLVPVVDTVADRVQQEQSLRFDNFSNLAEEVREVPRADVLHHPYTDDAVEERRALPNMSFQEVPIINNLEGLVLVVEMLLAIHFVLHAQIAGMHTDPEVRT